MNEPLAVMDLLQRAKELAGTYENAVLAEFNDQVVRMSLMAEPYFWHLHPDSDEIFLGVEGTITLQVEDRYLELSPGQMFTVPKGVKHRTAPKSARSINLTIERAEMTTVKVDDPSA